MRSRIELLSLTGQPGPVAACHLECGDLTVLVGRNDSGKTFVLDGIDAALRDDAAWHMSASLEVFFRADRSAVVNADATLQVEGRHPGEMWLFGSHELPPDSMSEELRDRLIGSGLNEDGHLCVLAAPSEGLELWIWVCAAPWEALPDDVRSALRDGWPAGAEIAAARPWRPLPIDPVAAAGIGALLEPIRVPAASGVVQADVGAVVIALTKALRLLADRVYDDYEAMLEGLPVDAPSAQTTREPADSARWLLDDSETSTSVCQTAQFACEVLTSLVADVLPDFVASRYRLHILPRAVTDIARGETVAVMLEHRASGHRFPLEQAASGFTVWLQLALREAASNLRWCAHVVDRAAQRLDELAGAIEEDEVVGDENAVVVQLARMLKLLGEHAGLRRGLAEGNVRARYDAFGDDGGRRGGLMFDPPRQRLYLLDEPEQRLHPALVRRAAAWLAELMDDWGAQCILATHSLAFIDVDANSRVHEVIRQEQGADVVCVDMNDFGPQAQLAREMGFDRGEMLSRWKALLFVEGAGDVAVLEELYGERLRRNGIMLSAVHGHASHLALLEMQLLLTGISTPVAALVDGISAEELERIRRDHRHRKAMLRQQDERATVARIVEAEIAGGRQIELLPLGAPDIFDVLSEDAIRDIHGDRYPGHAIAQRLFNATGGGNAKSRKQFYRRSYGVLFTTRNLRRVAERMRARGTAAPRLDSLIDRVELLALSNETSSPPRRLR